MTENQALKAYTMFFPVPSELPPSLHDPEMVLGDPKVIDGISATSQGIKLGGENGGSVLIPFDQMNPPEIPDNYVHACEFVPTRKIFRRSTVAPRHTTEEALPILLRAHLFCAGESGLSSAHRILSEPVSVLFKAEAIARSDSGQRIFWQDILFQVEVGGAIQLRPAGLIELKEWVFRNSSHGPNFMPLAVYLNLV